MDGRGLSIKATQFKVRQLVELKRDGRLFLPDLQRGFVWDAERIRMLFDSLYRGYPVGSLLLWKPGWEDDQPPLNTRPWDIYRPNQTTGAGEPEPEIAPKPGSLFVLDGQQRLTSLLRVIFDSRKLHSATPEPNLFVALSRDVRWRDEPFLYESREVKKDKRNGLLVRAEVLFAGVRIGDTNGAESQSVARAIAEWLPPSDPGFFSALDRANEIRNAILNAELSAYEIDTGVDDDSVIEIFGRLNQQAIRLNPGDLAAARLTGQMRDFRRRADQALQAPELRRFSTREGEERALYGGYVDTDLIVRVAMGLALGIVKYRDAEKSKANIKTTYAKIEPRWDDAVAALQRAVAIFRGAGVPDGSWIPYRYILLTPAIAFGHQQHHADELWLGWAIAASLWGLYGGSAETKVQSDVRAIARGDVAGLWAALRSHAKRVESLIPERQDLAAGLVKPSGVHLAQLVHWSRNEGKSFRSGYRYAAGTKRLDEHHIFPRVMFIGPGHTPRDVAHTPDRLGNLTLLTEDDNRSLGAELPEAYLATLSADVLAAHCIPEDPALWSFDRYTDFCDRREELLFNRISDTLRALGVT